MKGEIKKTQIKKNQIIIAALTVAWCCRIS